MSQLEKNNFGMQHTICILPKVHGIGGMVSFLEKFSKGARELGVNVTNDLSVSNIDAVLVIVGTRDIFRLQGTKKRGIRIVQRLDGINWIHRIRPISLQHTLKAEYGNWNLSIIRRYIADRIIYQSGFSNWWWDNRFGKVQKTASIIYNGVDLDVYSPAAVDRSEPSVYRLLVVEGSLGGGYENGLENAVRLAEGLAARGWPIEVQVVGEVSSLLKNEWTQKSKVPILWRGLVKRQEIPAIAGEAHLLFSADIHPACPNSVIESLACGLPVTAYDTGSLSELVNNETGFIGSYGSDSWKLEKPDPGSLVTGAEAVLKDWKKFHLAARKRAELLFGLDNMVKKYLEVLLG